MPSVVRHAQRSGVFIGGVLVCLCSAAVATSDAKPGALGVGAGVSVSDKLHGNPQPGWPSGHGNGGGGQQPGAGGGSPHGGRHGSGDGGGGGGGGGGNGGGGQPTGVPSDPGNPHGHGNGGGPGNGHGRGHGNGGGNGNGHDGGAGKPVTAPHPGKPHPGKSHGHGPPRTPVPGTPPPAPAGVQPTVVVAVPAASASATSAAPAAPATNGSPVPTKPRRKRTSSKSRTGIPRARHASGRTSGGRGRGGSVAQSTQPGAGARLLAVSPGSAPGISPGPAGSRRAPAGAGGRAGRTVRSRSSTRPARVHGLAAIPSFIGNLIPLPFPVPDWSKPIIFILLVLCLLLGIRSWVSARRARRLESQRRELAADLASMQAALVPEIPAHLGPVAVSVGYRPADGPGAGGDFYDAFPVDGGRVAIIVGDVSGHGRAALTRATHMRYTLRAYVETGLDPRSALKLAGRVLATDEDDLFATVVIGAYDARAATLTYATAGHPDPVILGSSLHEPLTGFASPALGWGASTGRRQTTVPFSDHARACFFSDGVTEVRTQHGLLGRERLARIFTQAGSGASAPALLQTVRNEARTIRDDMAACVLEATAGTAVSEHVVEELELELGQLKTGQGDRFLSACGVSPAQAAVTLARAGQIAGELGAALLRVELTGHSAEATACGSAPVALEPTAELSLQRREAGTGRARPPAEVPALVQATAFVGP